MNYLDTDSQLSTANDDTIRKMLLALYFMTINGKDIQRIEEIFDTVLKELWHKK
jgi:hypothetical protein